MSDIKDKLIQSLEDDSENWITRRCVVCGGTIKVNVALDPASANSKERLTCGTCLNKD